MPNDKRSVVFPAASFNSRNSSLGQSLFCAALLIFATAGCVSRPSSQPTAIAPNQVIVRLVSRHAVITISAGPGVPLYTVADASGHVLVAEMSTADLKKSDPDIYEQISPLLCVESEDSAISGTNSGAVDW